MSIPRLLIITDWIPAKTRGGVSQTLFNLFDNYPADRLLLLGEDSGAASVDVLEGAVIKVRFNALNYLSNRLGKWGLNRVIAIVNGIYRDCFGIEWPTTFAKPELIIVSATSPEKLHLALLWSKVLHVNVIPYFMDDWMADSGVSWGTNNLYKITGELLRNAANWMMISDQLKQVLEERYSLKAKNCLVIHNPVEVSQPWSAPSANSGVKQIIYAGSIFAMHYDALLLTAKAVNKLNQQRGKRDFELVIYTSELHWGNYKHELQNLCVRYGGFIHPDKLESSLKAGWLLLVTSAFKPELAKFSRSSVQTKITEYMRTSIPILAVGPNYSACNAFVRQWEAGFVFEQEDEGLLASFLATHCDDLTKRTRYSKKAYCTVLSEFSKLHVQAKLKAFIK